MTNKAEALARLAALEAEAAALRNILEKPDTAPSLLKRKEDLLSVHRIGSEKFTLTGCNLSSKVGSFIYGENYFESLKQACDYAEAFETFLLLRRQPGTVKVVDGEPQWVVSGDVFPDSFQTREYKLSKISPVFTNRANCEAAINAIGAERLHHMFNTFHHVGA